MKYTTKKCLWAIQAQQNKHEIVKYKPMPTNTKPKKTGKKKT